MLDYEKKINKIIDRVDNYINNVILAESLPLTTVIFFRYIPWMFFTAILGFLAQPILLWIVRYFIWLATYLSLID